MSAAATKAVRLLSMEIRLEHDVVLCRRRTRQFAAALGFATAEQIRVATALSEIARNAFQYAGGARVEFSLETEPRHATPGRPQQSLVIVVRDSGPGIAALETILAGQYRSGTGLGLGILGAQRLMDRLEIATAPSGTMVTLRQILPLGRSTCEPAQAQAMVDELLRQPPEGALEEMQWHNQQLLQAMEEARKREEEIKQINQELAETNAGVLALYDELETLHRVSLLLATQLELKALIQSIIDVTTELTDADMGAFYFRGESDDRWSLFATAGRSREVLAGVVVATGEEFFGPNFGRAGLLRIPDLETHPSPCCASGFARALEGRFRVRGCLTVPVVASNDAVLGAMVFAAAEPARFTERSERIVGSIAAQAVLGIEKSRLFHAVKASSEAKDQFLAMISHELRTPLNPVLAIVSSWHGDARVPVELREEVAMVARNVRLEARLIDDLLDFNKLINGKLQLDHTPVDLHEVVESAVEICRDDVEERRQHLEVNLHARSTTVAGDAARLQQVLWNVLKNAIKFTPEQGTILLETSNPAEGTLRVVIRDNGRGIEPEALARIFGAFEQGQPQVLARFGGMGLGLAISKTFVERHGGTIGATSAGLGHGSQFTIDLPLCTTPIAAPVPAKAKVSAAPENRGARLLLVEDHADTLTTLTRLLTRKGHTVTPTANGAEARAAMEAAEFDLIISDLGLPDGSGLELMADLRARYATPAIALSGYGMESDVLSSRAAGFNEHLTKPIDFERLLRTVDRLLSEGK